VANHWFNQLTLQIGLLQAIACMRKKAFMMALIRRVIKHFNGSSTSSVNYKVRSSYVSVLRIEF
jgi:hypothetical protein